MEIGIVIGCVVLALDLTLWAALFSKLNWLMLRLGRFAERHDAEGERRGMTALQEAVAARVGVIVRALRNYEEGVAAGYRTQVADAEIRARLAERQASEAGVALSAASALVRELRRVLDAAHQGARAPSRSAPTLPEGRETVATDGDEGERLSEDERTHVVSRPLPGLPGASKALVSPAGEKGGAR
jgi:hypothetical protein